MGKKGFSTDDYTGQNFDAIPADEYQLALVKAERKQSKTPGNYYLNCQFTVTKGEFKKRVIFHMFNLENANETAVEIAENNLREFMMSVGVTSIRDPWDLSKLMNIPFTAKVVVQKSDEYGDSNKIKRFVPLDGEGTTTDHMASKGSEKPPWEDEDEETPSNGKKKKKDKKKDKKEGSEAETPAEGKKKKKDKKKKKKDDDVPF